MIYIKFLLHYRFSIALLTFTMTLFALLYSLSLPNIYRSYAVLTPNDSNSSGIYSALDQLSGLATLGGLNIPSVGKESELIQATETLKSFYFFQKFFETNDILIPLMAAIDWDQSSQEFIIDKKKYDIEKKLWIRDVSPPRKTIPSQQEAFEKFQEVFSVTYDMKKNIVTLSLESYSPITAKEWLDSIIFLINEDFRLREQKSAEHSIKFLIQELQQSNFSEVRNSISNLLDNQYQLLALTNFKDEYFLRSIEPPFVSERKSKPKRAFICFMGLFFGLVLAILQAMIRHFFIESKLNRQ